MVDAADVLSQADVDALLNGVNEGHVDTKPDQETAPSGIRTYDFSGDEIVTRGRLPTLEIINDRFARNFSVSVYNLVRRSPTITLTGIKMVKFGEHIHTLLMPSCLNTVKVAPLRGSALVVLDSRLVFLLVESFFGGNGKFRAKIEGRDFTAMELRILEKLLQKGFSDLKEAWAPIMDVEFSHIGFEINPQFANIVNPSEVVVVSKFEIDIEDTMGEMQIILPYSMIEPIRDRLEKGVKSSSSEVDERWKRTLRGEIMEAKVEVNTILAKTQLTFDDLLTMRVGDIIPVDTPKYVTANVDNVPIFHGSLGVSRGNCALRVEDYIETKMENELMLASEDGQ